MSNMVTRCPQCHTSFKVTEEHLKIANGAVRCGSCLLVFQARQHWVNPENMSATTPASTATTPAATTPAATTPAATTPAAGAGKFSFDQSAIDNNATGGMPTKPFSLSAEMSPPKAEVEHAHKKLEDIGDDDRISDDLDIEDDEPEIVPHKAPAKPHQFGGADDDYSSVFDEFEDQAGDAAFDEILEEDFNDLDALVANGGSNGDAVDKADDAWAKDMLAEMAEKEKPEAVDLSQVNDVREILADFTNPVDVDAARRDLGFDRVDPFAARELGARKVDAAREGRAEMIAHIEPPPVELLSGPANHAVNWKSVLLWNASAVALALLLVIQYVGFNFDRLAKTGATRPYMQAICAVAQCKLPSVENWRYIKIQNLVVRQHPQVQDGLAVDAILFNVTGQELPFPPLELFFSDLAKTPVASRRFDPAEYLSGELSGQTQIPPGRPVHIAFEIVNPGEKAVNWSLQVAGKTD